MASLIGESGRVDRQQWDERYSGAEFEWSMHPNQFDWVVADLSEYEPAREAFELVLIAYLHLGAALRVRVLAGAAAALAPGGTLLLIGHDLTNLTEGVGGPQDPDVLYTPEAITAELPELRILRAERVRRTVERDGGQATAVDTLVRAVRPAR
jgi:hypothetical protein